jgi:hypothetical protein
VSVFSPRLGAVPRRPAIGGLLVLAWLGCAEAQTGPAPSIKPIDPVCVEAQPVVWPSSPLARRLQITRLQMALRQCIEDASFLATLGGLLLEDEDPAQALIWLERSLLLDPGNLGAQADHAIALAALGEPDALKALALGWRDRTDLPPGLRERLFPTDPRRQYALPNVRLGEAPKPIWGLQGDISLLAGRETNLDRSPRLSELTLTVPEGPLVLPVISQPRKGAASIASMFVQGALAVTERTVLRSGVNLNSRRSRSQPSTDWHQAQWATELEYRGSGWRAQVEGGKVWIGGPLNEPYQLQRFGLAAELMFNGCGVRAGLSHDRRKQSATELLNSTTELGSMSVQCPVPGWPRWLVSLNVSRGDDTPQSPDRPGGGQDLRSEGLRVTGQIGEGTRAEIHWRDSRVQDAVGYSVLLENNAIRRLELRQWSVELSQSLRPWGWAGWSASLQWQRATQRSNIQLFGYRADTVYGGLRWAW